MYRSCPLRCTTAQGSLLKRWLSRRFRPGLCWRLLAFEMHGPKKGEQRIAPLLPSACTLPQVLRRTFSLRRRKKPTGTIRKGRCLQQRRNCYSYSQFLCQFEINQPGSGSSRQVLLYERTSTGEWVVCLVIGEAR